MNVLYMCVSVFSVCRVHMCMCARVCVYYVHIFSLLLVCSYACGNDFSIISFNAHESEGLNYCRYGRDPYYNEVHASCKPFQMSYMLYN